VRGSQVVDYFHLQFSLNQVEAILWKFGAHSAVFGFEPVNEPLNQNGDLLFEFYRQSRKLVQKYSPQSWFVFHDAFDWRNVNRWNSLFPDDDMDKVAMDHHGYMAWYSPDVNTTEAVCGNITDDIAVADKIKYPVWHGEWSLATDICAHWLGGFNEGNTVAQQTCTKIECPASYMPKDFDTSISTTVDGRHGPWSNWDRDEAYVIGNTTEKKNYCFKDSGFFNHT